MAGPDDWLPLSGIQHFCFCRRQWALIHLEQQWAENRRTVEGQLDHARCHDANQTERRGGLLITRGMQVVSRRLGLSGNCDVVEFRADPEGIPLQSTEWLWKPMPVEYKHGRAKASDADRLQLCAQAMALEEMLVCSIPEGALFYEETRRREVVPLTEELRQATQKMADEMGVSVEEIQKRVESLAENNPMLGHRGCRLGITFPEITEMQTRAILGAACELKKEGKDPKPEIMVPLVGILYELKQQKEVILATAKEVFAEEGIEVEFEIGTMIETPRAALTANRIASEAEYFSFGTNDLTQMTFGYSRDDIASFLPVYLEKKILTVDPFQVLDQNGVGQLIKMAVEKGRSVRPGIRTGICGEHGGEPSSVKFCAKIGMDYASCSPFRVPIARLAAAQAALED